MGSFADEGEALAVADPREPGTRRVDAFGIGPLAGRALKLNPESVERAPCLCRRRKFIGLVHLHLDPCAKFEQASFCVTPRKSINCTYRRTKNRG